MLEMHGHVCHLCGGFVERAELHIDHVIPVSRGGTSALSNLMVSHGKCNLLKGDRLLAEYAASMA